MNNYDKVVVEPNTACIHTVPYTERCEVCEGDEGLTVRELLDNLREIKDPVAFRMQVDKELFELHEMPDFRLPNKLKQDVAGLLYSALGNDNE